MKKTLYTLLTATSLMSVSFAATTLGETSPSPATNIQNQTVVLCSYVFNIKDIPFSEISNAIANGAVFAGDSENSSLIHASSTSNTLEKFKPFLDECIAAGFQIDTKDDHGLTLLQRAAMNVDDRVAKHLIGLGLQTTMTSTYAARPAIGEVYPLFFAMLFDRSELTAILSAGLTSEQIQTTTEQVALYRETLTSIELPADGYPGFYDGYPISYPR